jgi:MinD superfamily P-loop ATPase
MTRHQGPVVSLLKTVHWFCLLMARVEGATVALLVTSAAPVVSSDYLRIRQYLQATAL